MRKNNLKNRSRLACACLGTLASLALAACGGGGDVGDLSVGGGGTATTLSAAQVQDGNRASASAAAAGTGSSAATEAAGPTNVASRPAQVPASMALPASASKPVSAGPLPTAPNIRETYRVNTTVKGNQVRPNAIGLNTGGHVVAWVSASGGVCTQRYADSAAPAGKEVCVAAEIAAQKPGLAPLADGGFFVSWIAPDRGSGHCVLVQRFSAGGRPMGQPQRLNTADGGDPTYQSIAALAGEGFVAVWRSADAGAGVFTRRFDGEGRGTGAEMRVSLPGTASRAGYNTEGGTDKLQPAVAGLAEGGYVIAWAAQLPGLTTDGLKRSGIYVRRMGTDGAPIGAPVLVSDPQTDSTSPALTGLKNGSYAAAWQAASPDILINFRSEAVVFWAAYAADGRSLTEPTVADARSRYTPLRTCYTPSPVACIPNQAQPTLSALNDGGYVLAWIEEAGAAPTQVAEIYAVRLGAANNWLGRPGGAGSVNRTSEEHPVVAPRGTDGFVFAWQGPDSDGDGIYAKNYGALGLTFEGN